jgi:hypothetical protein
MKRKAAFFVAFEKVEKQDDGTMLVSGVASSEVVDADGETITSDAMKAALPDYMKFGAIREMHQPIAAGSAIKCEVDAAGVTHLEAKIVDPTTVMKIEEEVLKGFSVGGKVTSRDPLNKTIITGIRLTEISVVDRPANPEAVFKLAKVDGDEEGTLGDLRKGLWDVECFISILQSIGWLAQSAAADAEWEGDNSPVPAALRDWLADGAGIFQAMAAEEIAELLATLPAPPTVEVIQMAEKLSKGELPDGLAKAGAKFSKASKEALADIHKCLKDCDTKMAALGYDAKQDDGEDAAGGSDDTDKVAKAAKQSEDLQKAQDTIATLTKRVKELEAQPAPPKGVLNANSVVAKTDDHSNPDSNDAALMKQAEEIAKLPPEEQTRLLIKAIHAGPVATR